MIVKFNILPRVLELTSLMFDVLSIDSETYRRAERLLLWVG